MALNAGLHIGNILYSLIAKIVTQRTKILGIIYLYVGPKERLEVLQEWLVVLKQNYDKVAYIGDDVNDLEKIKHVRFSSCPENAVDKIKKTVDLILRKEGCSANQTCLIPFASNTSFILFILDNFNSARRYKIITFSDM